MTERARLLAAILAQPDPPDLIGRGHKPFQLCARYPTKNSRRKAILEPLLMRHWQARHLAVDGEPEIPSVKVVRFPQAQAS